MGSFAEWSRPIALSLNTEKADIVEERKKTTAARYAQCPLPHSGQAGASGKLPTGHEGSVPRQRGYQTLYECGDLVSHHSE